MGPKRVNELPKIVMSMCDGAHNQHIECNMVKIMENKTKVGDVPNVAEKNQLAECWARVVRITLGWMNDINDRMPSVAWAATTAHRNFIEFIENMSEDTTFEEFKEMAQLLMHMHASARNDIYDYVECSTNLDSDGRLSVGESRTVSREERDVLELCQIWWKNQ